jgi:hypothetical protein
MTLLFIRRDMKKLVLLFMLLASPVWAGNYSVINTTSIEWDNDGTNATATVQDDSHSHTISNLSNLQSWTGGANISTVGTITTGVWNGTTVKDAYIASASTWNSKGTSNLTLLNFSATDPITYDNTTGAIGWTNSENYIKLTNLSAGSGISYDNTTGVISSTAGGGNVSQTGSVAVNGIASWTADNTINDSGVNVTKVVINTRYVNTTAPITGGGDLSADRTIDITVAKDLVTIAPLTGGTDNILVGSDADITIAIPQANATQNGYLDSGNFTTFASKGTSNYTVNQDLNTTGTPSFTSVTGDGANLTALNATSISSGTLAVARLDTDIPIVALTWNIGDGTNAINTSTPVRSLIVPFNGTITKWSMKENLNITCNITLDVQKASNETTAFSSIQSTGARCNITNATGSSGTNLTSWNTTVTAGEVFKPVWNASNTTNTTTLSIWVTKT